MPPLMIQESDVDEAVTLLDATIAEALSHPKSARARRAGSGHGKHLGRPRSPPGAFKAPAGRRGVRSV